MFIVIVILIVGLLIASFFAGLEWIQNEILHGRGQRRLALNGKQLTNIDVYFEQQTEKKRKTALNLLSGTLIIVTIYMLMAYMVTPNSINIEKQTTFVGKNKVEKQVLPSKRVITWDGSTKCYVTVSQTYALDLLAQREQTLVFDRQCSALANKHQKVINTMLEVYKYNLYVSSVPDKLMKKGAKIKQRYGGQPPPQDEDDEE